MKTFASVILLNVFLWQASALFSQAFENKPQNEPTRSDSLAQQFANSKSSIDNFAGRLKRVVTTSDNLVVLGFGAGMGLMFHPLDKEISNALQGDDSFLLATFPDKLGSTATILSAAALTYAVGRLSKNERLADTGILVLGATITTQFVTLAGKYLVQRPRPDGRNNHSFPSGHASGMFAAASMLDARYGYKVGVPGYLLASFVSFSRIRMGKHYPTDVVSGAILGVIIGRSFGKENAKTKRMTLLPYLNNSSVAANLQISF